MGTSVGGNTPEEKMLQLLVLSLLGSLAHASISMDGKISQKLNHYNAMANCFGHEMMMEESLKIHKAMEFCKNVQSPMFNPSSGVKPFNAASISTDQISALRAVLNNPALASILAPAQNQQWEQVWGNFLNRNKRQATQGLIDVSEADEREFIEDIMHFKNSMYTKMGNLSCVLTQLEVLDSSGEINMEYFSYNTMIRHLSSTPAGSDPAFVRKMADGFSDCWDISRAWPQKSLDRHPMTKQHGRHMIFFECAKKSRAMMCTQFQMRQWIDAWYGKDEEAEQSYNLPGDKYDRAAMAIKVLMESATPEEMFVDDFFWSKSKM